MRRLAEVIYETMAGLLDHLSQVRLQGFGIDFGIYGLCLPR